MLHGRNSIGVRRLARRALDPQLGSEMGKRERECVLPDKAPPS